VTGDWRDYRSAIWLAMLAIAVALLLSQWYVSAIPLGAAIGSAIRIRQRRRRAVSAGAVGGRKRGSPGSGGR
jgi:hypothetical protein